MKRSRQIVPSDQNVEIDSAMLSIRKRSGFPARRRPGWLYLTIAVVIMLLAALLVGRSQGTQAGIAAGGAVLLWIMVSSPLLLVFFGFARTGLRRVRDSAGLGTTTATAIRSTADFSAFPPVEIALATSYTRPWQTFQLMSLTDKGIELRTIPKHGWSGGAHLRFDRMNHVEIGSASFGDFTERAILIAGHERGSSYCIGIVPVDETSITLKPVTDEVFRSCFEDIIERVRATARDR